MAIAKMSHLRLVGLRRDQNRILDVLTKRGLFEARATDALPFELSGGQTDRYRELKLKQSEISFALNFLKARHAAMASTLAKNKREVKKGKALPIQYTLSAEKYSDARRLITKADFSDAAAREYELMHVCEEIKQLSFKLVDCNSHMSELTTAAEEYKPYAVMPIKLSELRRDDDIVLSMYSCRSSNRPDAVLAELPCAYEVRYSGGYATVLTVSRKSGDGQIEKQLGALGYTKCAFTDDCTAEQKVLSLKAESDDVQRQIFELTKSALDYEKYVTELKILYDVIELDIERAQAEQRFLKSDSAFVLEGWVPERYAQDTVDEVAECAPGTFIQLLAPEERDAPPTLLENNAVVKPFEQVTDLYSSPKYREIDPNPIMSVFYFVFFGIMIGDAAYGLILAVLGLIVGRSKRFDNGMKQLALLIAMGGISAVLWGVIFGGYFGVDFGDAKIALWFNPLDEPLTMLIMSLVLGCVQLVTGYIIKFVALCKEGKPFSAIFDCGSIITLFAALACLALYMVLDAPPAGLSTAAIVLAAIGGGLILIFGGRAAKNVLGKVVGGFKGLYGLINIFSDILSYCRLFGLGLASCAIALAFNTLGGIIFEIPVIGYVLGTVILIPFHAFNLGIGVLGAYVNDARLQFMEFYGKFYEGGGRLFVPLGSRTKYVRFS